MKILKITTTLLAVLSLVLTTSCSSSDDDENMGKWYRRSDFEGKTRAFASAFTIGEKGYICGGFNGNTARHSDLWEYDMNMDYWTQKADLPAPPRNSGVGFAINSKGYVGTGYDTNINTYYNDFWAYDPSANAWTEIAQYPGAARIDALAFSINGKGYVGCGFDQNYLKDFFAYNPSTNTWEEVISIGGSKRQGGAAFVIGNYAYVCCGHNNNELLKDLWRFDPTVSSPDNPWTELREIADTSDDDYDDDYAIVRKYASAFVIDGYAYVALGSVSGVGSAVWKYSPSTDLWEEYRKFKGSAREGAVSFSNGQRGYVVSGRSGTSFFDDIWEFKPDEYDDDEY